MLYAFLDNAAWSKRYSDLIFLNTVCDKKDQDSVTTGTDRAVWYLCRTAENKYKFWELPTNYQPNWTNYTFLSMSIMTVFMLKLLEARVEEDR